MINVSYIRPITGMQIVPCKKQRSLKGRVFWYLRVLQQRGGAFFVGTGSSMDVMNEITFMGNTVAYESFGAWVRIYYIVPDHTPWTLLVDITVLYLNFSSCYRTVVDAGRCMPGCNIYAKTRFHR